MYHSLSGLADNGTAMPLPSLDMDRAFLDFNICELGDPTLKAGNGPSQACLIEWVYKGRQGDRSAILEFTNTMYMSLQEETFRCFERVHGARVIPYRDWFYCKLVQLLNILVYEQVLTDGLKPDGHPAKPETDRPWEEGFTVLGTSGPSVPEEEVEATFAPGDNDPSFWGQIVDQVCAASGNRLAVLEEIMAARRHGRGTPKRWEWRSTSQRNEIIRQLQAQGKDGLSICEELDRRRIAPLPILKENGIESWIAGWTHPTLHRAIEQLLSRLRSRSGPVKS